MEKRKLEYHEIHKIITDYMYEYQSKGKCDYFFMDNLFEKGLVYLPVNADAKQIIKWDQGYKLLFDFVVKNIDKLK
ncbi:hypothetical protein [Mycoplasmopsis opalescens]|uniref:hypothetical protein n=1 Tax=Mycoplasmopsis opalescens TaxID=114886 RepID=UPI0004A70D2E|nr:hypothetical protein [Mycoplasmopsis opalescens]